MCVYKSNLQGTVRKKGVEFCCVGKVICQTEPAALTVKFPLVHYNAKAQVTTDCVGSNREQKCYSSPLHTADSPCLPVVSLLPLIPSFPSRFIPSLPSFSRVPWLVPISLMSNQASLVNSLLAGFSHIYTSIPKTLSRQAAPQIPTHFHTCPQIIISLLSEFSDKVSTTNIFQNQAELLGHIEKGRLTTSTFVIATEPVCSV